MADWEKSNRWVGVFFWPFSEPSPWMSCDEVMLRAWTGWVWCRSRHLPSDSGEAACSGQAVEVVMRVQSWRHWCLWALSVWKSPPPPHRGLQTGRNTTPPPPVLSPAWKPTNVHTKKLPPVGGSLPEMGCSPHVVKHFHRRGCAAASS